LINKATIRAITFDLWDTVFIDDSDEPKRAAQGLAPKPVERRNLVQQFLDRHEPISRDLIDLAYDTTDAAFRQVWYGQNVTWTVRQRLSVLLKGLKRSLPEPEFDELVRLHEDMELAVRPDLAPNVTEALSSLHGKYQLGVISDAIFSPGRALRRLLADYDILKYFHSFVFSDGTRRAILFPSVLSVSDDIIFPSLFVKKYRMESEWSTCTLISNSSPR